MSMTPIATRSNKAKRDAIGATLVFTLFAAGFCALWVLVFVSQPPSVHNIVIATVVMTALLLIMVWQLRLNYVKIHHDRILLSGNNIILAKPLPRNNDKRAKDKTQKFEFQEIPLNTISTCSGTGHTITITTKSGATFTQDYIHDIDNVITLIQNLITANS